MVEHSEQIGELATALAKAQSAFVAVPKGKTATVEMRSGGKYSYKYADLADALDVARKPLSENGLSIVQAPAQLERGVCSVTTMLLHISGQWIKSTLALDAKDATPQSIGTVITYARRYSLAGMLGLATDDDTDAQEHAKGSAQAPARQNGAASYSGVRPAERPATPDDVRVAHAAAVAAANGRKVEPVPDGLEDYDQAGLNDWLRYYRKFAVGAAQRPAEPAAAK